jgi:hypothetical protein
MSATAAARKPAVPSHDGTNPRAEPGTNRRPPAPRLDSAIRVRRELARLYGEARAGTLAVGDASKLANVLQILGRMIETGDLEGRLEELERRAEVKG